MNYQFIISPENFKTQDEYEFVINNAIRAKENEMVSAREELMRLNNSSLGLAYLEKLEYDKAHELYGKKLTESAKKRYEQHAKDYMDAYNAISSKYDKAYHEWQKLRKEKQIVLVNFTGE